MSQNNTPGLEPVSGQPQGSPAPAAAYRPPVGADASPLWPTPRQGGSSQGRVSAAGDDSGKPTRAGLKASDAATPSPRKAGAPRGGRRAQRRPAGEGKKKVLVAVVAVVAAAAVGVGLWFGASMLGNKGAAPAELAVGQCVNWEGITDVLKRATNPVIVTDCAKPHDGEIIATGEVPEGFDYLSRHVMVMPVCSEAFDSYIGIQYSQSSLAGSYYDAPQSEWEQGNRAFACIAHNSDGSKIEGSVKNSQR